MTWKQNPDNSHSVYVYVDGVNVGSGTAGGVTRFVNVLVGAYNHPASIDQFAKALIDELEVYSRALSVSEIYSIYSAGYAGKCKSISVQIDVKPGSDPNCFNINGHGIVPVAILGSEDLDVGDIDTATLTFAGLAIRVRGQRGPQCSIEDSNGDQFLDMVCQFEDNPDNWLAGGDTANLTGALLDGTPIEGTDSICTVP